MFNSIPFNSNKTIFLYFSLITVSWTIVQYPHILIVVIYIIKIELIRAFSIFNSLLANRILNIRFIVKYLNTAMIWIKHYKSSCPLNTCILNFLIIYLKWRNAWWKMRNQIPIMCHSIVCAFKCLVNRQRKWIISKSWLAKGVDFWIYYLSTF